MLRGDRERPGFTVGQVAWRLGVTPKDYRELEAGASFPTFETWDSKRRMKSSHYNRNSDLQLHALSLQAKVLHQAAKQAEAAKSRQEELTGRIKRITFWLTVATFALALATVALVVATVMSG